MECIFLLHPLQADESACFNTFIVTHWSCQSKCHSHDLPKKGLFTALNRLSCKAADSFAGSQSELSCACKDWLEMLRKISSLRSEDGADRYGTYAASTG